MTPPVNDSISVLDGSPWRQYLNADPLPRLLEKDDCLSEYLTLRDILHVAPDDELYSRAETAILNLLQSSGTDPGKINSVPFDHPREGALQLLSFLTACGLDSRTEIVNICASRIIQESMDSSGGFSYSWNPRVPVSCLTGWAARLFLCSGTEQEAALKALEWISERQRHDGGWLSCPVYGFRGQMKYIFFNRASIKSAEENDGRQQSCPYASVMCGLAMSGAYERGINTADLKSKIESVCGFLFAKNFFSRGLSCAKISYRDDPYKLAAPFIAGYDLLTALTIPAEANMLSRSGISRYFNTLMSKQNPDGTWSNEGKTDKNSIDKNSVIDPVKITTISALKILSRA